MAAGVLGSLVMRVVNWGIGLVGGGLYLWMRRAAEPEAPAEPAELATAPAGLTHAASEPVRTSP
jgi:hypothetical protein